MNAGWNEYKDIKETLKGLIEKGYTVSMIHQVLEENFTYDKAEKTEEWILCKDRLPEEYCPVMATVRDRTSNGYEYNIYPEVRYSEKEGWEWAYESGADYWTNFGIGKVIAWRYYPEPCNKKGDSE